MIFYFGSGENLQATRQIVLSTACLRPKPEGAVDITQLVHESIQH